MGAKIVDIILLLFGAYDLICGIATLVTRKVYGMGKSIEKYTPETVREGAPFFGIGLTVLGILFIASNIGSIIPALDMLRTYDWCFLIVGVVFFSLFSYLGYRKMEKK